MGNTISVNYSTIYSAISNINMELNDVSIQRELSTLIQVFDESQGETVDALKKQAENLKAAYQVIVDMMIESKEMLYLAMRMYNDTDANIAEVVGGEK